MELKNRVQEVLNEIRPHLQADCGDAKLIGVDDDGTVRVNWSEPAGRVRCPR